MIREKILQLLQDSSVQDPTSDSYEQRIIRDNDFGQLADILSTTTLPVEDVKEIKNQVKDEFGKLWNKGGFFDDYQDFIFGYVDKAYLAGAQQSVDVIADLEQQIRVLRDWKESAISVTPDMQAIGKAIGVKLGDSVHDKILPWIINQKAVAAHHQQGGKEEEFDTSFEDQISALQETISLQAEQLKTARSSPSTATGGWVKTTDQLPGIGRKVKWRRAGNTRHSESTTVEMLEQWPASFNELEWLDDTAPVIDMAKEAIAFAEWIDNRATRNDETGLWIHSLTIPNDPLTSDQLYSYYQKSKI